MGARSAPALLLLLRILVGVGLLASGGAQDAVGAAGEAADGRSASARRLAEVAAVAMTPQHSLLMKLKEELSDPGDTLASWVPEVGPCEWGEDSFAEGWAFVKCGGGVARELYLVGATNVTGDVTARTVAFIR